MIHIMGFPTASIITVTQISRQNTLKLTREYVDNQDYPNLLEWVIVEGSKSAEDCMKNETFVKSLVCKVPIVYVPGDGTQHLGELRNISNRNSKGDIIIVMDDDDWYPSTRVSHAVERLACSPCKIAGCSPKMMYDYDLEILLQFRQFGPNHSTNDCFAYKREYLDENSYDPSKDSSEEASFTKQFTNPLEQLDPNHTIISSSHSMNTFSKKELSIKACLLLNPVDPSHGTMYPPAYRSYHNIIDPEAFKR